MLPDDVERALYLDSDIIVLKDIFEFYNRSFEDKYFVACPDVSAEWGIRDYQKNVLSLPENHIYFNSGVLLLNIKKLRENTTAEGILSVANKFNGKLMYYDQDMLNILYTGKVKYADVRYNYQNHGIKKGNPAPELDVAIMHYVGFLKPWKWRSMDRLSKYYWHTRFKQGHVFETAAAYTLSPFARFARHIRMKLLNAKK